MKFPDKKTRARKLHELMEQEGYDDLMEFLSAYVHDSVVPGICIASWCNYATEVEPDQDRGWCEECRANSVVSCLVLAGLY